MRSRLLRFFFPLLFAAVSTAAGSGPVVSLYLTADPSIPQQVARLIRAEVVRLTGGELAWNLAADSRPPEVSFTGKPALRSEVAARGAEAGAEIAINIRFHEAQRSRTDRLAFAHAWVVSVDSAAYFSVAETAWSTFDTTAMRRRLGMMLRRLLPYERESGCFAVVSDVHRPRSETGQYLEAGARISVFTTDNVSAPGVSVRGHWTVNYRMKVPFQFTTGPDGADSIGYTPPDTLFVNDIATPTVDWVDCPDGVFDQQWPQRQVDRAVAILENARADLDEDSDYDSAIERARRFLDIRREVVHWYDLAMTSPLAVDRKVQARYILRRAEAEKERSQARRSGAAVRDANDWMFGLGAGYYSEIFAAGSVTAEAVNCEDCEDETIRRSGATGVGLRTWVRRRVLERLWTGVSFDLWRMKVKSSLGGQARNRIVTHMAVGSDVWVPLLREREFLLYVSAGPRFNWYSTSDTDVFWSRGAPKFDPGTDPAFKEPVFEGIYPGLGTGIGLVSRATDWMPIWWSLDFGLNIDRAPGNLTQKLFVAQAALTIFN